MVSVKVLFTKVHLSVQVMEHLKNHEMSSILFQGLESHGI